MRSATDHHTESSVGRPELVLAAICCAVALSACGSSSEPGTTAKQSASLVEFANCMRSHGVPNFPDSTGGATLVPAGVNPGFKTSACSHLLPQLHAPQPASAQASKQLLKFANCMRSLGLTGLPDPTPTQPYSHGGYSAVIRRGGVYLAVPVTLLASPAYKHATAACRWILAP